MPSSVIERAAPVPYDLFVSALPILIVTLSLLAVGYRFYSAFLAARVLVLDDSRTTPAHLFNDHQNFHPTNKWVLFGHHFAAISGAGPLVGPVLACQFGYFPGLAWLLIGVVLGGAVQDFTVLVASMRRGGRSLAEIARSVVQYSWQYKQGGDAHGQGQNSDCG